MDFDSWTEQVTKRLNEHAGYIKELYTQAWQHVHDVLYPYKPTEVRNHQWDTSISGDYRCCFCGTRAPYGETDQPCTKT